MTSFQQIFSFPNSVNIFITNALNSVSGKLFVYASLFFSRISLAVSVESIYSAFFMLVNFLCQSGYTVMYYSLEVTFLCGSIPVWAVCAQCLKWEGWN